MEVKIVTEPKPEVKEMTVDGLQEEPYIGIRVSKNATVPNAKYMYLPVGNILSNADSQWMYHGSKRRLVEAVITDDQVTEIHVFDTAQELYRWMAE